MIPTIWWNGSRGNWDCGLLLRIFEQYPEHFPQYNDKLIPQFDRAIVIVVGRPPIPPLKNYLSKMKSGVVIMTGDEECSFECERAVPKHLEMWTQCYAPHRSYMKERLLLGTPNRPNYKINTHLPKKYLCSFVGQVQNPHRSACVEAIKSIPDSFLHIADGFGGQGNGIEYQEYLDIMCQSKYVLCPSGSMVCDTFRIYEAIEAGAIPITDKRCPRDPQDYDYWDETYPNNDLIKVSDWSELPSLIEKEVNSTGDWWGVYKQELEQKLINLA